MARHCTPAVRYIRVIALVATSDAEYLSQLCLRDVPMATMTCELGMRSPVTHRPTPAAFPACCLVVSGRGVDDKQSDKISHVDTVISHIIDTVISHINSVISHIDTVVSHIDTFISHIDAVIFHIDTVMLRSSYISIPSS